MNKGVNRLSVMRNGIPVTAVLLAILILFAQGTVPAAGAETKKETRREKRPQGKTSDESQPASTKEARRQKKSSGKSLDPSQIDPDKVKKLGTFKMEKINLKDTNRMKGNYLALIVNLSGNDIIEVRAQRSGTSGNPWTALEPIGQTCDHNMKNVDKCIKEKKWAPLIAMECGGTYNIEIIAKEPMGIARIAHAEKLQADCSSEGGVLIYRGSADF